MPRVVEAVEAVRQPAWVGAAPDSTGSTIAGSSTTSCTAHRVADCNSWYTLRAAESTRIAGACPCCRD